MADVEAARASLATLRGAEWIFPIEGDPVALSARLVQSFAARGLACPYDPDEPPPSPLAVDLTLAILAGRLASWATRHVRWARSGSGERPTTAVALNRSLPPDRLAWIDEAERLVGTPLRAAGFRVLREELGVASVDLAIDVELSGRVHAPRYGFLVDLG